MHVAIIAVYSNLCMFIHRSFHHNEVNILRKFSHSNGTVIIQTARSYGHILDNQQNVHQRNPIY